MACNTCSLLGACNTPFHSQKLTCSADVMPAHYRTLRVLRTRTNYLSLSHPWLAKTH